MLNLGTAAFVAAGGCHHSGLNTGERKGGAPSEPANDKVCNRQPDQPDPLAHGWGIDGAISLPDPDPNGIALARHRDPSHWVPLQDATPETIARLNKPLDVARAG